MSRQTKKNSTSSVAPRRLPVQQRAKERTQLILDTTAELLVEVGIDDLTTILIAAKLEISVGSLYHYFPNKHAILHELGARWLDQMTTVLEDLERLDFQKLDLPAFINETVERMLEVYRSQTAVEALSQALASVPELRALDQEHDQMMAEKFKGLFERAGVDASAVELTRLGYIFLETTHTLLVLIASQKRAQAKRTTDDVKRMLQVLLEPYL